mmetsp:Transcript_26798/g.61693  ORF Transcript_26798/g.61693 Transcript_26798/m.61693 type:complete len:198 (-) Transcript_26798:204-797(-)|eukprot:CAMPEP_0113300246 /NCGR_PEP_ID=MMETSP0010_2-20120614/1958_1 /TAXON_ID=216773 ORGANISM="Corethron hystrix, Strain 308" /NCGR_SAMPLE_ID=MMETSP0010_2 /ASSEMBLY_ACC=CAM_ASM_000155 /LENGTH=197 /DNA_ID=CAMNT_0000153643 /DNA_START=110 /DNA_END=703 /DNA_ORIENTATION=- /assembly_acc=CAM_ASM_000155
MSGLLLLAASLIFPPAFGFVLVPRTITHFPVGHRQQVSPHLMSIFDDLKLIFSEEGKKNRAEYEERERAEMEEAQRQIMERRNNPEKMEEYEAEVMAKRRVLAEDKSVWDFQTKTEEGYDPLTDWERLRAEGKITVGSDMERDKGSERLGSEGLVEVRTDELLPYIDQGYVDDDADVMGKFMNIFGGKKAQKAKNDE